MDYPALVIPVSKVDQAADVKAPSHEFLSKNDKANYDFCAFPILLCRS